MMKLRTRRAVQVLWTALTNSYARGFVEGRIYRGQLKKMCVPGLNCYSCPGALGACPLGSLQSELALGKAPLYVAGLLILFGAFLGRLTCGFLCPFGLVQELLYKIKCNKRELPRKLDRPLRGLKYLLFAGTVVLLPLLFAQYGSGAPYFCKYICPAGALGGGIPLMLTNETLRSAAGPLFALKIGILAAVLAASVFVYRPFCKYLCPLGAFYALFNRITPLRLRIDDAKCTRCGACARVCRMQVPMPRALNGTECVRCGDCIDACPADALSLITRRPASTARRG